jgi:tape measure domain-containing protein
MTKTVSYTNVHLSYTADLAGLRQAKSDMAAMNRVINQAKTDTQRYEEHVQKLDRLLANGKINQQQYNNALEAARTRFLSAGAAAKSYQQTIASLNLPGSGLVGAGAVGAAGIAATTVSSAGIQQAKQAIQAYGDLQMTLTTLEVIYGDAGRAAKDFAAFRQMAAVSPLETKDFTNAAVVMAQYGVNVEQIVPRLKSLAEISAGNSERMATLSLAFGQVAANGRLMGQEVLQMVNSGFNPLAEISRTTGRSMQDLRKDMENGLITFDMVAKAFDTATEAGGRFYGMNEKLGKTIPAQQAQLRDEFTKTQEAFGQALAEGGAVDALSATSYALKGFNEQLSILNKHNASLTAFDSFGVNGFMRQYNAMQDMFVEGSNAADIERMTKEADDLQKAQEKMGQTIADAISSVPSGIAQAGQTYAGALAQFGSMAEKHARDIERHNIKKRAAEEAARKKELESDSPSKLSPVNASLSSGLSVTTKEGIEYLNQLQSNMQQQQLNEQRRQTAAQLDANKLLKKINDKPAIGVVK